MQHSAVLADPATHTVYAGDAFGGPVSFFRFQLPRRPTDVTATAHDAKTQLRWRPPYDGGLPVIYQVITTSTCPACHGLTTPATSGQPFTTTTGLTPRTSYTFKVNATSAAGIGRASAASNPVRL